MPGRAVRANPAARLVGGEGGHLLGLVEKLFAVPLHALDVVHHAVAAGEGVLQFGRRAADDPACWRLRP